jgi:hypothetical protein
VGSTSTQTVGIANKGTGALCIRDASSVQLSRLLSDTAREVFDKPYRALVDVLKVSDRDAHYRLSGKRKYTAIEIAMLLRSEDGFEFLTAIMANTKPRWWQLCLPFMRMQKSRDEALGEINEAMRETIDAHRALTETIAKADSLAFYGQEQAGVQADALREINRVPDRSVAQGKRR